MGVGEHSASGRGADGSMDLVARPKSKPQDHAVAQWPHCLRTKARKEKGALSFIVLQKSRERTLSKFLISAGSSMTTTQNSDVHLMFLITVKSRIQYAHLYNTQPKLSQENHGKTLVAPVLCHPIQTCSLPYIALLSEVSYSIVHFFHTN